MKEILRPFPVVSEWPIAWGEMDAFQHVNNIIYFRFFESARICYFEKLGLLQLMEETGIGPILASTQCRFRIPLTYPDTVSIGAKISEIDKDRFKMEYLVVSHRFQKVAANGEGILVTYNYRENCKVPIPENLKQKIEAMEKQVIIE
ncbi:MAG: thioesterase family protein [Bacteroidota bacterium]